LRTLPPARRASKSVKRPRKKASASPAVVTRFRMPSQREAIARAVDRVLDLVAAARLSEDERDNLAVAVAEALSNAAVHGHRLRPGANVRVAVAVTPGVCATVEVADSGPGFDSRRVSDPTEPEGLLQTRGRGVFLMRRLVDDLVYNGPGNKVRLTMEHRPGR
jgi:serine/threonine-protein kinase RsbW